MLRLSCMLLLFLVYPMASFAEISCGEQTCIGGEVCIDRGDGRACWPTCRMDSQCDSGCCIAVQVPNTVWICGTADECGTAEDGDEQVPDGDFQSADGDLQEETDGDSDMVEEAESDITPGSPTTGVPDCSKDPCDSSTEACISVDSRGPICVDLCADDTDCESECCVNMGMGVFACIPDTVECPANRMWISDNNSNSIEVCGLTDAREGILLLLLLLLIGAVRAGRSKLIRI